MATEQIIDILLTQDSDTLVWDIGLDANGDLETDTSFNTTFALSIFGDRRAEPDEVVAPYLRRGWIGDVIADVVGFLTGSKLWLFKQARLTDDTISGIRNSIQDSVDWMVEDGLLQNILVETFEDEPNTVTAKITGKAVNGEPFSYLFEAWNNTGI